MSELPTHLRQEMASLLNDGIIGDLFSEIFSECSPPLVAAILLRLELMVAVKGDILCCEGDVGEVELKTTPRHRRSSANLHAISFCFSHQEAD